VDALTGFTMDVAELKVGESRTYTQQYIVTVPDILTGTVTDTATATADPIETKSGTINPEGEATASTPVAQNYTLTINYWLGGTTLMTTTTQVLAYNTNYNVASPAVDGYTVDLATVNGVLTQDTTVNVYYTAIPYTLTLRYVYQDGTLAAPTRTQVLTVGANYDVVSPAIDGFTPNRARVTGTMPARNVIVTVIYIPNDTTIVIEDLETPLGLGNASINVGECIE